MNRNFGATTEWVIVSLCLGILTTMGGIYFHQSLEAQNRLAAKRLGHSMMPLIAKAHHIQDDLALQEIVAALAQAPGISTACIVDKDEKVVVHNHLDRIGKPFLPTSPVEDLYSFPLREGAARWGTLFFSLSQHAVRQFWLNVVLIGGGFMVALSLFYGFRLGLEKHRLQKLHLALADQAALTEEERVKNGRLSQEGQKSHHQARQWIQSMVETFSEPLIMLDGQQRIIAFNATAKDLLGLTFMHGTDLSWQDVRWLQNQGNILERSLQTPNTEFCAEDGAYCGTFRTEGPLTWVKPKPALRVCR